MASRASGVDLLLSFLFVSVLGLLLVRNGKMAPRRLKRAEDSPMLATAQTGPCWRPLGIIIAKGRGAEPGSLDTRLLIRGGGQRRRVGLWSPAADTPRKPGPGGESFPPALEEKLVWMLRQGLRSALGREAG